jgi:ribose transport system permease protein
MTASTSAPKRAPLIHLLDRWAAALYLAALLIVLAIVAPQGFTAGSAAILIQLSLPLVAIALGMTFCLVCGEVDLSVAGMAGLASTLVAVLLGQGLGWPAAVAAALAAGLVVGVINGAFTALLLPSFPRFPSFLVTLATLSLTTGLARALQPLDQAVAINDAGFQAAFRFSASILTAPTTWYTALLVLVVHLILSRSRFGYAAYAVGLNPRAASFVGIRVVRIKVAVMVLSAVLAAFGGVMMAGYVQAGFSDIARGAEIDALAAGVIGGAALTGGRGSAIGTVWGVLILGVLNTGLMILQVTTNWQMMIKGALVIAALALAEAIRARAAQGRQ